MLGPYDLIWDEIRFGKFLSRYHPSPADKACLRSFFLMIEDTEVDKKFRIVRAQGEISLVISTCNYAVEIAVDSLESRKGLVKSITKGEPD